MIKPWVNKLLIVWATANKQKHDGSDGKAEASGPKGAGFNPRLWQEKIKIFSLVFGWLLWSLLYLPLVFNLLMHTHVAINNQGCKDLIQTPCSSSVVERTGC